MQIATPEQESRKLQQAQRKLHEAQEKHADSLKTLRRLRAHFDAVNHGQSNPDTDAGRENKKVLREIRQKIDKATAERDKARDALTTAKDAAAEAEREACKAVGDKHRPEYLKRLRAYVTAKLQSIEPLAVAAAEAVEVREATRVALGVRREHFARMQTALDLLKDNERFDLMRAEVVELLEAGTIKKTDIPEKLRKAWKL